jgi:hypothetical protein
VVSASLVQDLRIYEDEVVQIKAHGEELQITRLANNNPTTVVWEDGELIRHHGEHCHLTEHLEGLVEHLS